MAICRGSVLWIAVSLSCLIPSTATSQPPDLTYHTVPTCVAVHTAVTGGAFAANEIRTYNVVGDSSFASQGGSSTGCGVPGFSNGIAQVQAVELNVVAYTPTGSGYLKVYPTGQPVDRAMLFYTAGTSIADTGAAAVAQTSGGDITIQATAATHVVVKVVGYYTKAVQTVFVHPVPGDHTASGTRLINALAAITDASATKRYVVKIEPGIYDVGSAGLQMKAFVDLEGSGQEATVIRGEGGSAEATAGVIMGAASSEIRDLQVKAEGTQASTVAILLPSGANTSIRDVTISSTGPQITWGIRNASLTPVKIEGATITTTANGNFDGYGISTRLNGSAVTVKRTTISVSGGTGKRYGISAFTTGALSEIRDVQIHVSSSSFGYGLFTDAFSF
ncbi:MAG TPA: hypothetical protein VFR31_20525, partial [Thermoanaerobaculia bacterium]|nr:hypothetical protein [Thermoanaerobaculia bacterium]